MYSGQSIADERRLNLSQARLRTGAVRWSGSKVIGRRRSRRPVSSDPHCWMSRFLRCGCHRRPQSELQPSIWAGRGNVWEQIPEVRQPLLSFCSPPTLARVDFPVQPASSVSRNAALGTALLLEKLTIHTYFPCFLFLALPMRLCSGLTNVYRTLSCPVNR